MIGNQNVEPEVVRKIMALAKTIGFTDTLFVSAAGDNSDGSSWDRAYTSLITALNWIEANQAAGEVHCIMLQAGNWDLDLTGVPTFATNIAIYGVEAKSQTIISNGNATATGVLQFTGWCSINNLTIDCGTGETGINLNGVINGCILRNLIIITENLAGAADGILLDGGNGYTIISDIIVVGEAVNTTALRFNDASRVLVDNFKVFSALVGIHLDNAADDDNIFSDCYINNCATGILIDAGANDVEFHRISFDGNTVNIDDSGTTTSFVDILLAMPTETVFPADVAGILIVGGVGANTYSAAAVQIRAASATPFKIIGVAYECAAAEKTGIRLYSDGGTDSIWDGIVETIIAGLKTELFDEPIIVNQGLAIHGRVKSEAGGNNCLIWLKIVVI